MSTVSGQHPLYREVLGSSWDDLAESIQRLHSMDSKLTAHGQFNVRRGKGPLVRLICDLLCLPDEGLDVPIVLKVTTFAGGENWRRAFNSRLFVTSQTISGSLLKEHVGPLRVFYRLEVLDGGGLRHHQAGTRLAIGALSLPLPDWMSPKIDACESSVGSSGQTHIRVRVRNALLGDLIEYEGLLDEPRENT